VVDRLLSDEPIFKRQGSRIGGLPFGGALLCHNGDSKAPEAAAAARFAVARLGLDVDAHSGRTGNTDGEGGYGVGGSTTGSAGDTNLTSPARMAAERTKYQQLVAAGYVVDEVLRIGTNDGGGFTPEQTLANIRKHHNEVVRAAGCRRMILMGIDPKATTAADNRQLYSLNRLFEQYAQENSADTVFIDTTNVLLDPAAANDGGFPIPYTYAGTGTAPPAPYGSVMRDYVHKGNYGSFVEAKAMMAVFPRLYPRRALPILSATNEYGTGLLRGNLGGTSRRARAIGGSNFYDHAGGTGTVTGTPPAGSTLQGEGGGSFSMAFATDSITTTVNDAILPAGVTPTVGLTFSGSTGTNRVPYGASVIIGSFPVTYDPAVPSGTPITGGCLLYLDGVQGLIGIAASVQGAGLVKLGVSAVDTNSPLASVIAEPFTGYVFLEAPVGVTTSALSSGKAELVFYFAPNRACSGKAHLILSAFAHRADALPAAA